MRIATAVFAAILLYGCQSLPSQESAKSEVAAATQKWIEGMSRHDVEAVAALYDRDAVLWGTRSATLRDKPDTVRDYVVNIMKSAHPTYKVTLGEQRIRTYGDMAINSGTYTFSEVRDGKEVLRPARFSFVYRYRGGQWLILDHHSSAVPS